MEQGLKQSDSHRGCRLPLWNAVKPAAPPFSLLHTLLLSLCFIPAASSAYTGVIIGIFIAALIVGSVAALAKALYSGRHRICLGNCGLALKHVQMHTPIWVWCIYNHTFRESIQHFVNKIFEK